MDPQIQVDILNVVAPQAIDRIVEIGPGTGALTQHLIASGAEIDAIEIDRDLAAKLSARFGHCDNFHLHAVDVLRFNIPALATLPTQLRIIGNLPYNISTPLLLRLIADAAHIRDICVMVQKEVALRLAAAPGSRLYGRLSVIAQAQCQVSTVFDVPPKAFAPPPRVDSTVLTLQPHRNLLTPAALTKLQQVVAIAFSQRRKMLRHTLGRIMPISLTDSLGISLTQRAEEISVAQYMDLAEQCAI